MSTGKPGLSAGAPTWACTRSARALRRTPSVPVGPSTARTVRRPRPSSGSEAVPAEPAEPAAGASTTASTTVADATAERMAGSPRNGAGRVWPAPAPRLHPHGAVARRRCTKGPRRYERQGPFVDVPVAEASGSSGDLSGDVLIDRSSVRSPSPHHPVPATPPQRAGP